MSGLWQKFSSLGIILEPPNQSSGATAWSPWFVASGVVLVVVRQTEESPVSKDATPQMLALNKLGLALRELYFTPLLGVKLSVDLNFKGFQSWTLEMESEGWLEGMCKPTCKAVATSHSVSCPRTRRCFLVSVVTPQFLVSPHNMAGHNCPCLWQLPRQIYPLPLWPLTFLKPAFIQVFFWWKQNGSTNQTKPPPPYIHMRDPPAVDPYCL